MGAVAVEPVAAAAREDAFSLPGVSWRAMEGGMECGMRSGEGWAEPTSRTPPEALEDLDMA